MQNLNLMLLDTFENTIRNKYPNTYERDCSITQGCCRISIIKL